MHDRLEVYAVHQRFNLPENISDAQLDSYTNLQVQGAIKQAWKKQEKA